MTTVLDQAQNIGGIVSAARARERWQQAEAKASGDEAREQYREAIADLEFRFPELEDIGPGGAEAFARERGHGSKSRSPVHEGRKRIANRGGGKSAGGPTRPTPAPEPEPGPKPVPGLDPAARRVRVARRSRLSPRTRSLYRQTGIPQGYSSGQGVVLSLLGMTVGLSLLYLVLTSAERRGSGGYAVPQMLRAVTAFFDRFIAPVDILGGGSAIAAEVRKVNPAGTRAERRGGSLKSQLLTVGELEQRFPDLANLPAGKNLLPDLEPLPGTYRRRHPGPRHTHR